jgi:hypothetical protein
LEPSRYIVLNGLSPQEDKTNARGVINKIDGNPYYPYYDQSKHPFVPPTKKYQNLNHSAKEIYQMDKSPYYGPTPDYRILNTSPNNGIKVGITIGDLTEITPTIDNIIEYQRRLDKVNNFIAEPKKLLSDEKFMKVYQNDPNAYYDPTNIDLFAKKAKLEGIIADLKERLRNQQSLDNVIKNKVDIMIETGHVSVQNKVNIDKEVVNQKIANNYWYSIPANKIKRFETNIVNHRKIESEIKSEVQNKPVPVKIQTVENKLSPSSPSKQVDIKHSTNNQSNIDYQKRLVPDTQGLKTERVRIVTLKK